jgi:hypothetical protein
MKIISEQIASSQEADTQDNSAAINDEFDPRNNDAMIRTGMGMQPRYAR